MLRSANVVVANRFATQETCAKYTHHLSQFRWSHHRSILAYKDSQNDLSIKRDQLNTHYQTQGNGRSGGANDRRDEAKTPGMGDVDRLRLAVAVAASRLMYVLLYAMLIITETQKVNRKIDCVQRGTRTSGLLLD